MSQPACNRAARGAGKRWKWSKHSEQLIISRSIPIWVIKNGKNIMNQ